MVYSHIGKVIKTNRNKKRITQQELARKTGISQSFISKIENGSHSIDFHLIERIALFLEIDIRVFNYRNTEQPQNERTNNFINKADKLLKNYQYDEVKRLMLKENRFDYSENISLNKAFLRLEGRISFIELKELEEIRHFFQSALNIQSSSLFDLTQDAETYISLANCLAESAKYSDAIENYQKALTLINQYDLRNKIRLKIRVLYNLAKSYREQSAFIKALKYIKEALSSSLEHEDMGILNHLYYQKAMILNQMKILPECKEMLEKSSFYAQEMRCSEAYPFIDSFRLILELNEHDIWEHEGKWLTEYKKEEIFLLYTKLVP
jgi:transcriptional regulator with XRE-family HTH domain